MEIRWPGVGVLKILPVGSSRETGRLTKGGLLDRWEFCAAGQPLEEARVIRLGSLVGARSGSGWVVLIISLYYIEVKLMAAVLKKTSYS